MLIAGEVKYRFQGHREFSWQSLLRHSLLLTQGLWGERKKGSEEKPQAMMNTQHHS
jgi:hypothetical protein